MRRAEATPWRRPCGPVSGFGSSAGVDQSELTCDQEGLFGIPPSYHPARVLLFLFTQMTAFAIALCCVKLKVIEEKGIKNNPIKNLSSSSTSSPSSSSSPWPALIPCSPCAHYVSHL